MLGYLSFFFCYLLRASYIISMSLRLVWSIRTYFFERKSGTKSKPPFLPPIYKDGREAPPIAGRSDFLGFSSFLAFFFAFLSAMSLFISSIFLFSSSDYYVPWTSTISVGFLISYAFGSSTFGTSTFGTSTFGSITFGASILGTSTLGSSFGGSA